MIKYISYLKHFIHLLDQGSIYNIIFLYLGKSLVDATAEVPPKIEVKWLR